MSLNRIKQSLKPTYQIINRRLQMLKQVPANRREVSIGTAPGNIFFEPELKQLLECNDVWLQETATEYRQCRLAWQHLSGLRSASKDTDGFAKSLDVAEGLAVWALVKHVRPKVVVELGVQYGISSRLWKEALKAYVPDHEFVLCDLEDKRYFIGNSDSTFYQEDARKVLPEIFSFGEVGIFHYDADHYDYDMIHWSVSTALEYNLPVITCHDVGRGKRGVFNPTFYDLPVEQKARRQTQYGALERHVMAEIFDKRILYQDYVDTEHYRLQIFDSLFGFGVVMIKNDDSESYHKQ